LNNPNIGELYLADIGVPNAVYSKFGIEVGNIFAGEYIIPVIRTN